jgi:hypothetical protein
VGSDEFFFSDIHELVGSKGETKVLGVGFFDVSLVGHVNSDSVSFEVGISV